MCACVCECVCARPGGREAGGGGGRRSAGAGSWSPGEAKKVNSSCCARAWENPAPCAWPGLIGARCVWGVCVCMCVCVRAPPHLLRPPPGLESEGAAGWEPSPGADQPPPPPPQLPPGQGQPFRAGSARPGVESGELFQPPSTPDFGLEVLTPLKASLATARGRGGGLLVCSLPWPSLPPRGPRRPPWSRDA